MQCFKRFKGIKMKRVSLGQYGVIKNTKKDVKTLKTKKKH